MSDPRKPQRLGSLGSGQERLKGRRGGRGGTRKFTPTISPRPIAGSAEPGNVKPAIPKLLEVVQRPEVEQKPLVRVKKFQESATPSTVTFVASDVKKSSSFVPNDRSLRSTSAISYNSTPSGSPLHDNDMDVDEDSDDASSFAPIILPFGFEKIPGENSSSEACVRVPVEDSKKISPKREHVKDFFQTDFRQDALSSEYTFWQLPARLPHTFVENTANQDCPKSSEKKADVAMPGLSVASGSKIPDGVLGKLVIYKSGKVVLRCGEVDFLVKRGIKYPYRQEIMAINLKSNTCNRLATVDHRVICTPDLSRLDHDFQACI